MSKLSPKMWYLLKYGFLVIIAVGIFATVLPTFFPEYKEYGPDMLDLFGENFTNHEYYINENSTLEIIHQEVTCCLLKLNKEVASDERSAADPNCAKDSNVVDTTLHNSQSTILKSLYLFQEILASLEIKAVIIEPSILYCLLLQTPRNLLIKRNFNITNFLGSKNIITYGIFQQDVPKIQKLEHINKLSKAGFHSHFINIPGEKWMAKSDPKAVFSKFTSHIFFSHSNGYFHLVVFYNRENYLWHSALDQDVSPKDFPNSDVLFQNNSAYEKFSLVQLPTRQNSSARFYIPTNPHHFLFQMLSSRFLECSNSLSSNFTDAKRPPKDHPNMSVERFNTRTLVVIHQLKKIFQPLLMNYWIWSGTMLGWYRQCDIIPYTTDVDFAAWAYEVEDLDAIIHLLRHNEYVAITVRMGLLEEALEFQLNCFKLRTDIFFMYPIHNGSWCSGHTPNEGHYFRYYYPPFTLCSAELLGEKVQVPCETESVIVTEYGPNWRNPIPSWDYKASIRNRGPNIHWSSERLKTAYKVY